MSLSLADMRREYVRDGLTEEQAPAEPRAALEQQEEKLRVRRALERLRPGFREILTLKYLEKRSYEEIAQLLGIPRGTVMSRLFHARAALREAYVNESNLSSTHQEACHE